MDERPEAVAEPEEGRGLPSPHGNQRHGLYSKRGLIRALLPEKEAAVWDEAPVPAGCPPHLEDVFREYTVMRWRVHEYVARNPNPPKDTTEFQHMASQLRLLHLPLRGILKATEVHARLKEVDGSGELGDAVLAYLRTLPDHRLEEALLGDEAPRFDPMDGTRLLPPPAPRPGVSRETEESDGGDH